MTSNVLDFIQNKTQILQLLFIFIKEHTMYNLLVRGSDRDGAADGLSSECACRIKVLDVNDNFPILEKTSVSFYSHHPFYINVNNQFPFPLVCEPGFFTCMMYSALLYKPWNFLYNNISYYLLCTCLWVTIPCKSPLWKQQIISSILSTHRSIEIYYYSGNCVMTLMYLYQPDDLLN